jgi:LacI family transcriptional regulator
MRALTQHILELRDRHTAVISGIVSGNDRAADRFVGVKDAVGAAGLPLAHMPVMETGYDIEKGAAAFEDLMARPTRPTVVICGNDVLAAGALSKAHDMGLRVPDDVSITRFDDIELARIVTPALTTVHVPHRTMGKTAARTLIDIIENKTSPAPQQLQSRIEKRASLRGL